MNLEILIPHALGGVLALNALPHLVAGVQGRRFPTPFAKPPGRGLSPAWVNLLWAMANLALCWALTALVGPLDLTHWPDAAAFGLGALASGLFLALHFGAGGKG